ncbi:tetratricopeptide repeat protein, partial [Escherichia coli]|uniref:tetratricopeptide repeat protein n=1 Tax=Escherichia coli TaxID=562 RepID=UPI0028DDAFC5
AGEALVEGDFQRAFWLIDASLRANPDSAASLNSLAVLLRRAGDAAEAERVFLHALDAHGENPNLLRNYRALLISQ